jgi:hypothetical protein
LAKDKDGASPPRIPYFYDPDLKEELHVRTANPGEKPDSDFVWIPPRLDTKYPILYDHIDEFDKLVAAADEEQLEKFQLIGRRYFRELHDRVSGVVEVNDE